MDCTMYIMHCKKIVSDIPAGDGKIGNLLLQCAEKQCVQRSYL